MIAIFSFYLKDGASSADHPRLLKREREDIRGEHALGLAAKDADLVSFAVADEDGTVRIDKYPV